MGGETLTAKNLALNANASTSGNGEFSFCGDNPSVTLVDRAGQSLELQLTIQKSGAGTDCYLTGFALSNGARLKDINVFVVTQHHRYVANLALECVEGQGIVNLSNKNS